MPVLPLAGGFEGGFEGGSSSASPAHLRRGLRPMFVPSRPGLGLTLSEAAGRWTAESAEFGARP